jgi:ring-1,2-phenylacetyl-CoA epoxidase subunit PaaD
VTAAVDESRSPTGTSGSSSASRPALAALWSAAAAVPDPEIPVLSVIDLGILRGIEWDSADPEMVAVTVTPTYSGCPATEAINAALRDALAAAGARRVRVETRLSPAWTTDWITADGRRKLAEFGIAPPAGERSSPGVATVDVSRLRRRERASADKIACPRCGSAKTELLSQFGSTACKAHYRCLDCLEPFDYFKPH